jgi:hypothetical protein
MDHATEVHAEKEASSDGFDDFDDPFKEKIASILDNPSDVQVRENDAEAYVEKEASSDGFDDFDDPFKDKIA